MITQPYSRLVLSDESGVTDEASPASQMGGANTVQLSVIAYEVTNGNVTLTVQVSNDIENWTDFGDIRLDEPGFFVMTPLTGICAQFVRVHVSWSGTTEGQVVLAVTQHTMQL